jgi:hypothetical protein
MKNKQWEEKKFTFLGISRKFIELTTVQQGVLVPEKQQVFLQSRKVCAENI